MNYDEKFRVKIESIDIDDLNDEYFQACIEYIKDYSKDFSEGDMARDLLKIIRRILE